MAGTNAVAYKKALTDAVAAAPQIIADDIQVGYDWPGHVERELIHGGRVEGAQSYPVSRGGGGRFPRDEELTVALHIVVRAPGGTIYEAELRASEIGTVVEELLAANPALTDVAGVIYSGIAGIELESDYDDDDAIADLTYQVLLKSRLT